MPLAKRIVLSRWQCECISNHAREYRLEPPASESFMSVPVILPVPPWALGAEVIRVEDEHTGLLYRYEISFSAERQKRGR